MALDQSFPHSGPLASIATAAGTSKGSSRSDRGSGSGPLSFWGHLSWQVDELAEVTSLKFPFTSNYCLPRTAATWGSPSVHFPFLG